MIPKVNRPPHLRLVSKSRQAENDAGSSQGSGVAYEKFEKKDQSSPEQPGEEMTEDKSPPEHSSSQIAFSSVVLEFRTQKKDADPAPGLGVRYHATDSVAKGLLLNKKA